MTFAPMGSAASRAFFCPTPLSSLSATNASVAFGRFSRRKRPTLPRFPAFRATQTSQPVASCTLAPVAYPSTMYFASEAGRSTAGMRKYPPPISPPRWNSLRPSSLMYWSDVRSAPTYIGTSNRPSPVSRKPCALTFLRWRYGWSSVASGAFSHISRQVSAARLRRFLISSSRSSCARRQFSSISARASSVRSAGRNACHFCVMSRRQSPNAPAGTPSP